MTCQPNGPWIEQQARNFAMELAEQGETATHLIKDGESEGIKVKRLPYRSPNLNAYASGSCKPFRMNALTIL